TPTPKPAEPAAPTATPLVAAANEADVRVETHDVIAVFTNRGARIKSWRLKHFFDQKKEPLELVSSERTSAPLLFPLRTPDAQVAAALDPAVVRVSGIPPPAASSGPVDLTFEYKDTAGIAATKRFHLDPDGYVIGFSARVAHGDRPVP